MHNSSVLAIKELFIGTDIPLIVVDVVPTELRNQKVQMSGCFNFDGTHRTELQGQRGHSHTSWVFSYGQDGFVRSKDFSCRWILLPRERILQRASYEIKPSTFWI